MCSCSRLFRMSIRLALIAALVGSGAINEAHAAAPRPGLAPLRSDGGYPVRIRLLSAEERRLRKSALQARNPGWEITLDGLGYIQQAKQTFPLKSTLRHDFARWHRSGKMPASYLRRIKRFIAKNRKQLAKTTRTLHTTIALGSREGAPSWRLFFYRRASPVKARRLPRTKLYARLLAGRRVVISSSVCPPCRPGGRCPCSARVLLDKPATRASTKLETRTVEYRSPDFLEVRVIASLVAKRRAHRSAFPKGLPSNATARVRPSGHIDAINGRTIDPRKHALYRTSAKPGIWISCPGCTDPFVGLKKVD